jgi:hypothetical protein
MTLKLICLPRTVLRIKTSALWSPYNRHYLMQLQISRPTRHSHTQHLHIVVATFLLTATEPRCPCATPDAGKRKKDLVD